MEGDPKKIAIFVVAVAAGIAAAVYGQPLIHGNDAAINVIVTTFSILAGFLVAIMTIIGDPTALLPGTWRIASEQRKVMRRKLRRHKLLFQIYLLTLGLIFVSALISKTHPDLTVWIERLYIGFAVGGFVLSLSLPGALMSLQEMRVDAVIEARKSKPEGEK